MPPKQLKKAKTRRSSCKHKHRNRAALARFGFVYHYFPVYRFNECDNAEDCPSKHLIIEEAAGYSADIYIRLPEQTGQHRVTRSREYCNLGKAYLRICCWKSDAREKIRRWKDCFRRLSLHVKKRFCNKRLTTLDSAVHPVTNHTTPTDVLSVIASYL